jgi:hypothetical protein
MVRGQNKEASEEDRVENQIKKQSEAIIKDFQRPE